MRAIGPKAIAATETLAQVINMKTKQFHSAGVRYHDCGRGALCLTPDDNLRTRVRDDYRRMRDSGMLLAEPPTFDDLMEHLYELESTINTTYARAPVG